MPYAGKAGRIWTVAKARAKFSEVIELARTKTPQMVTRNGRPTAVIVSAEEWARKTKREGTLAEFLADAPLRGARLDLRRAKEKPRFLGL